jgi:hypothetical protein
MGCFPSGRPTEYNDLLENVRKGRLENVEGICERWKTIDREDYAKDLAAAMEVVFKNNQVELAKYFLKTFNCQIDTETVKRLVAISRENCKVSCPRSDDFDLEVTPPKSCCNHYETAMLLTGCLSTQKLPARFLQLKYAALPAGTALSSRSIMTASNRTLDEGIGYAKLSQCVLPQNPKSRFLHLRAEMKPDERQTLNKIYSWQDSLTATGGSTGKSSYQESKQEMLILPDTKSTYSLATASCRTLSRLNSEKQRSLPPFFSGRLNPGHRGQGSATRDRQWLRPNSTPYMKRTQEASNDIPIIPDCQGATMLSPKDKTISMNLSNLSHFPEGFKRHRRASSVPLWAIEQTRAQHFSKESFDDIAIDYDTQHSSIPTKEVNDIELKVHSQSSDSELSPPTLFKKNSPGDDPSTKHIFTTDHTLKSFFRSDLREHNTIRSIQREHTLLNGMEENVHTYRSSTIGISFINLPVWSTTFTSLPNETLRISPLDTCHEDTREDDSNSNLTEWLIAEAKSGNIEMVCVLSLLGAQGLEMALAHSMANGNHEMADEIVTGKKRRQMLSARCLAIARNLGPTISRVCPDIWGLIAEMCVDTGQPLPLSTRKKGFFFRTQGHGV